MNTNMMPLSPTEQKILGLKDQGNTYKEIAVVLDVSINTVRTHAHRIIIKTMATCLHHASWKRRNEAREVPGKTSPPDGRARDISRSKRQATRSARRHYGNGATKSLKSHTTRRPRAQNNI